MLIEGLVFFGEKKTQTGLFIEELKSSTFLLENASLKIISRGALKDLFNESKIMIKGQRAKSSSAIAKGITYVDILGY